MSPVSPAHREMARELLEEELRAGADGRLPSDAAERLCLRFYRGLDPLVTRAGSRAFLSRSLRLTEAEHPFVARLRAGTTDAPCFEGIDDAVSGLEAAAVFTGFETVFGNMIGLLVTFIGEDLTMHALREVLPDLEAGRSGEVEQS